MDFLKIKKQLQSVYRAHIESARKRFRHKNIIRAIIVGIVVIGILSYLTNPFVRFNIVTDPYATINYQNNSFEIKSDEDILVQNEPLYHTFAQMKAAYHIVSGRLSGGKKTSAKEVEDIISEIHKARFDPSHPYLISGDHFSMLYPRSLGIFYHSLLDPRTALDETDWTNRETIYLKTVAYTLMVYNKSDWLSTTVVPIGIRSVAFINVYAPPSDTLFSILYALDVLQDKDVISNQYPYILSKGYNNSTKDASKELTLTYKVSLVNHYNGYNDYVYDEQSGLVRKDILLSGAKDLVKRQSAFYDNVIFWKTTQLAQKLGLIETDEKFLQEYKDRIVREFWYEQEGYFLEDLSDKSLERKYYSSDWLIAYQVGFLDPKDADDKYYLEKSIKYIQDQGIDEPFGLHYQMDYRKDQLHSMVRWFSPSYGSTAIWSNWGMEYIKLLTHLSQVTGNYNYLIEADKQLDAYEYNIKRYRGYPEVYDSKGDFYRSWFHKSVRQTGWIVSFEQAREMHKWTQKNWSQFQNGDSI